MVDDVVQRLADLPLAALAVSADAVDPPVDPVQPRRLPQARRDAATVVVSIFVNPLQFDSEGDLQQYPRDPGADRALCDSLGVDVIFAPSVAEMYPEPLVCTVDPGRIAEHLCGRYRPGHFRGVATVVLKLLEIVQPNRAYFGEKDAQQLAIVRRLVESWGGTVTAESETGRGTVIRVRLQMAALAAAD